MPEAKRESGSLPPNHFLSRGAKMYIGTRQVPEIDGSRGAFIAVVVTLSVLIVVCCVAVFYLLRHHEPTEQERAVRRERSQYRRTTRGQMHAGTATGGSTLGALGGKMKQLWQSTGGVRVSGGRANRFGRGRAGHGWIRAGSGDEWASRSDHEDDPELGGVPRPLPILDPKSGATVTRGVSGDKGDGNRVRVVESPQSDVASEFIRAPYDPDAYAYGDPFSKTTVSHGALQRSQSPTMSSPSSSPREQASLGHEVHSASGDYRHHSMMSNASVWTHGSKFVEDI